MEIQTPVTDTRHFAKERIFIVRIKKQARTGSIIRDPFVEVSYNDANGQRHMMPSFALKDTDVGVVAGELITRLIPLLGDK